MSTAAEVLVIILSVFLAFFLILGVMLTIYLIKLTREIRNVTQAAGRTVGTIESVVSGAAKLTSPLFMAELINKYLKKFKKGKKGE